MAHGDLVPLELVPRYPTNMEASPFSTIAFDVTGYRTVTVNDLREKPSK